MKKILLIILLSVTLITSSFVNVAHADINTVEDLLGSYCYYLLDSEDNSFGKGDEHLHVYQEESEPYKYYLALTDWVGDVGDLSYNYIDEIQVSSSSNNEYVAVDRGYYGECTVYYTFRILGDTIVSIDVSGYTGYYEYLNGTYENPQIRIYNVLNSAEGGYPSPESAWISEASTICYLHSSSNFRLFIPGSDFAVTKQKVLTRDGNNYKYSGTDPFNYDLLFELDDNLHLTKIHLTYNSGANTLTYEPLGDRKTVAEVLSAYATDFPELESNGWIKSPSSTNKLYKDNNYDSGKGALLVSGVDGFTIDYSTLLKKSNSNYVGEIFDKSFTFTINNDKLEEIQITSVPTGLDYDNAVGTYYKPMTIADIIAMSEDSFPTTLSSGWVDENGSRSYLSSDHLSCDDLFPINTLLKKEGINYVLEDGDRTFTFVIENGVFNKIVVTVTDGSHTYTPYKFTNPLINKTVGYMGDIEFITNAIYENDSDVTVKVDDEPLEPGTHYTLAHGSTHVTLKGSYVSTLPIGTHTITIGVDGYDDINQNLTISAIPSPTPDSSSIFKIPNTGIETTYSNNHLLLKLSSLSLLTIATLLVAKKKKDN